MEDSQEAGAAASPGAASAADRAAVILTPDQRVRVFISSTLEELAAERAAARRAIARLHLVPVWYESGARPHPPRSMYRAYLKQSQVFVGIYWQRYGWVAPGMEISGLEDEYRLAAASRCCCTSSVPLPGRSRGWRRSSMASARPARCRTGPSPRRGSWSGCWLTTLLCC
jgi:uncharacterized protein DUF4062